MPRVQSRIMEENQDLIVDNLETVVAPSNTEKKLNKSDEPVLSTSMDSDCATVVGPQHTDIAINAEENHNQDAVNHIPTKENTEMEVDMEEISQEKSKKIVTEQGISQEIVGLKETNEENSKELVFNQEKNEEIVKEQDTALKETNQEDSKDIVNEQEICQEKSKEIVNKQINRPKKRSRLEIELDIKESDSIVGDGEYDTFADDNTVYRKYRLRGKPQRNHRPSTSGEDNENDFVQEKTSKAQDRKIASPLVCEHCDRKFESRQGYVNHLRTHVPNLYTCSICKENFKSNRQLIAHKQEHSTENFACNDCKVAFSDHYEYVLHNIQHMKSPYKCMECDLVMDTEYRFSNHIITHYNKKIECEICNKFITPMAYKTHLNFHANKYECVECGKICNSKYMFDYHMITHTGVKRFQCLYCGRAFAIEVQRRVHTRIHTDERPFECKVCHVRFKQSADVKSHMFTHDREKKYKCDLCPKKYFRMYSLDLHKRVHLKVNLLKCEECGQTFQNMMGLRAHTIYKHLDDKPHRCDACDVAFKHRPSYLRHCRSRMHKNNMFGFLKKSEGTETNVKVK